ncbi:MAG: hypothetical protein ACR2PT_18550 [Endozoicomonas sp.]
MATIMATMRYPILKKQNTATFSTAEQQATVIEKNLPEALADQVLIKPCRPNGPLKKIGTLTLSENRPPASISY